MVKTLVIVARCRAVVWSVLYAMARKSKADKSGTEKGKSIELEGKRKSDNAWCECQVSLGSAEPSGTFLNVHFASFKNDQTDTIMQEDEVMARLRVHSTSLSDGECLQVKEGEAIVALLKSQSGRCHFFDAQVEKQVQRVKHSNKVFCRCTFEIKWLEGKMKGETVTVPASSIRRLVHENINNHPVISAFFKAVQAANMPSMSLQLPSSLPHEDSDIESDLHDRLEQQIEEIAKLADNSENAATEEMPSRRTTVNVNKRHRGNVPTSHDITVYNKNANEKPVSRTSARKRNRVSSETVCKDAVTVRAATLLHSEKRPRLSPLAARAALAAAVWNLPLGKQNFVAKKQDSVDQSDRNAFRKQLDKVSLKLSDTYFDIRSQGNYKGLRKRAASSARGKSPKRPRASNFHEHPDNAFKANRGEHDGAYKKHLRNASADRSVVGTPQLISVSTKQETSSDIASTVKGPSSTAGVAVSLTKKMIQKRHKGTSKEVSSTRSRKRSAGVMPVRSSPRFQSSSQLECNKQQPLLSQENTDSGKKESVVTENVQREQSGRSSTARVKSRMPIKGKKQLKASANEPELATLSADSLEAKHPLNGDNNETFSEAIEGSTQHNGCKKAFKAASVESKEVKHSSIFTEQSSQQGKVPQGKAYNTAGKASKAALIGAKKGKHLLKGAIAENITEVVRKRPKENGISDDKKASHASLVEPKNQLEEVPSLDHMTSNSTEISLEATKKRTQNEPGSKKMDSKATTSISRKPKKTVTSTRRENSNGMDKAEHQPLNRKRTSRVTCSHEGEYSRKVGTHLYKSLQAQPRSIMREEKKHASRKSVVRSSPRLRFLPRTRSQKNTTGGHQWALGM